MSMIENSSSSTGVNGDVTWTTSASSSGLQISFTSDGNTVSNYSMSKECASCGTQNTMAAKECMACGQSFDATKTCMACGKEMAMADKECAACGASSEMTSETETAGVEIEINVAPDADEETTDTCPECGADMSADAASCPDCGAVFGATNQLPTWESELAFEGMPTTDGRFLMPGGITNRALPLTLMCQYVTADGHDGAEVCGKLTNIWRVPRPDLGSGVVAIMGSGEFSDELMGPTAAKLVEDQVLRGVSVDIAPTRRAIVDAATLQEIPLEDATPEAYMNGDYLVGIEGELMGATLVPFPAFGDASMRILGTRETVVASAASEVMLIPRTITASAAGMAPLRPPKEWFFQPEPAGKFPLTVMDDGRVMGHLATWDQCHHGFLNECVLAKPSRSEYAYFHVGQIKTKEGELIDVGRIVVGDGGHAAIDYTPSEASRFYDKTSCVGAFVRAVDGEYGIWLSGVVRSDCPSERVRDMMANPPSGDWRSEGGWLELIAALSVPVAGFPVPRYEYALTASAETNEVKTLVATGYYELEKPNFSRAEQRRREVLLQKAKEMTADES